MNSTLIVWDNNIYKSNKFNDSRGKLKMGLEDISAGSILFYTLVALSPLLAYSLYDIGVVLAYGRGKAESVMDKVRNEYREKIKQFKTEREFETAKTEAMVNVLKELKLLRLPGADYYKNMWLEEQETKLEKLKTFSDY